ncbi:MAG: hypothetical protein M3151_00860 [Actinomycetota bacterium]|nr:hypothetical protein [Actinomycetota bacterium]
MRGMVVVSGIAALIMLLFGMFWMFTWLIGTNGYSTSKGTTILLCNLVLVLLSIVVSSVASGRLAKELKTRTAWSLWITGPLSIIAVTVATVVSLFVGSVIVVLVFGRTL